ncbi:MAG: DUF1257 domain-containing protein [Armatimonadota bacterium]|nr:DUF1257 domain-containing protein [Armatimonadota bacterium]
MSHLATVSTQIRDLDALAAALERLGCRLDGPGAIQGYFRDMGRADHIIRLPNSPYTVGLVRQPDGTYTLQADLWAGHVERVLGQHYGRLLQEYAVEVVTRAARRRGQQVRQERLPDGRVRLRIRG